MIICQTNEWADMDEEDFLIILKNYIEVEEWIKKIFLRHSDNIQKM
jgi:hypothetical protein